MEEQPRMKDATEDIGFICDRDPWEILAEKFGEPFREYRRRWEAASSFELELDYPLQLDFELNNNCNLRCPSCTWSHESPRDVVSFPFEKYAEIITDGIARGLRALDMSYVNEPLIRKDLCRFIRFARDAGILDIAFNTNANLLSDAQTDELLASGLTRIQFSVDAFSSAVYDEVRPGGKYDRVMHNIEHLLARRRELGAEMPLTAVSFLKMSVNEDQLEDFVAYWRSRVDYIIIREYLSPYGRDSEYFEEKAALFLSERHIAAVFRCDKPWQRMVIRADGTVLPCCTFFGADLPVGNVYEDDAATIWVSSRMQAIRKLHAEGRYAENPVCLECAKCSTG